MLGVMSLLAALCLLLILAATDWLIRGQAMERAMDDFGAARQTFYRLVRNRVEGATAQVQLIAELPVFRAAVGTNDPRTVGGMAEDYRRKLDADFCLVASGDGMALASPGLPPELKEDPALAQSAERARQDGTQAGLLSSPTQLYVLVTVAARNPGEVLGTLTAGYRLGDRQARELASLSNCDVVFSRGDRIYGSSLMGELRVDVADEMRTRNRPRLGEEPSLRRLGRDRFVTGVYTLWPAAGSRSGGGLLLLHSWTPTMQFLDRTRSVLLLLGTLSFALSAVLGLVASNRLSRPLRSIAAASRQVAAGDWDIRMPVGGSVEAAEVAESVNRMIGALQHYSAESASQAARLAEALAELEHSYTDTLEALSRALDARDNETEGHSLRVTETAVAIALEMRLDEESLRDLRLGALLHDIGKIGVPDAILRKPGRLTPDELQVMRGHCELGLGIVRHIHHLDRASDVIRCHHERWDGGGYPAGIAGEEIPLSARIFSVSDTLDAMTSDRPYRKACSFETAIQEIRRCSGSQFDPQVVEALERWAAALPHLPRIPTAADPAAAVQS